MNTVHTLVTQLLLENSMALNVARTAASSEHLHTDLSKSEIYIYIYIYIYIHIELVCDERPSLHKFERPSCWMKLIVGFVSR